MKEKEIIAQGLSKLEFLANTLANVSKDVPLHTEGMYFVLTDVIEEIKKALDGLEDRQHYIAANQAA